MLEVAGAIAELMDGYRIIVTKSTVSVGTHKKVSEVIASRTEHPFDYVSNPEFLKEGSAVDDFMKPARVIIGTTNPAVMEIMKQLYAPFMRKQSRIIFMDPASAELTKYAANSMLATRISFMNEMSALCEKVGADIELVRTGIGSDPRIGNAFLFAGVGYGGSCFPKDVRALASVIGEEELTPLDHQYLEFGESFERKFVNQSKDEVRTIEETLELGWEALSLLPVEELHRVSDEEIEQHYRG